MYDVSLDVFVWFSRPHHLLVFINLRKRLTHYFKTSLTSPKCNGFDVIETSLPRFCARRLRNVFRTKNGSLGYDDTNLAQHWLRKWLGAVRHHYLNGC